jgi:cytochrome c biogenesis protein CcdA
MNSLQDLSLVFAAGVFATFNPCGFAMLPAYMTILLSSSRGKVSPLRLALRAFQFSSLMSLGVISVFALFAAVIFPISTSIQRYLPIVTIAIGFTLIIFGLATFLGKAPFVRKLWSPNTAPSKRSKSLYLYGVTFALGSVSCTIGPLLAATSKSLNLGLIATFKTYLIYALGMSATILILALVSLFSQAALGKLRSSIGLIEKISAVFLIAVGFYLIIFGIYETQWSHLVDPLKNFIDSIFALQGKIISLVSSLLRSAGVLS